MEERRVDDAGRTRGHLHASERRIVPQFLPQQDGEALDAALPAG